MKTKLVLIGALLVACYSCNNRSTITSKSAIELKQDLESIERDQPLQYLSVTNTILTNNQRLVRKAGLFRDAKYENDGALITGSINNSATIARYKDPVLKVSFYSKTSSIIKEETFTLYEFIEPNRSKSFTIKTYPPGQFKSFSVTVLNASNV